MAELLDMLGTTKETKKETKKEPVKKMDDIDSFMNSIQSEKKNETKKITDDETLKMMFVEPVTNDKKSEVSARKLEENRLKLEENENYINNQLKKKQEELLKINEKVKKGGDFNYLLNYIE